MKKTVLLFALFCTLNFSVNAQHGARDTAKTVAPFKIFDNLYYIGVDFVSAYLLTTDDGLILIDALYGRYPKHILQSVRDLGYDPKQIKYILCTHGHWDHCEGADTLQQVTHAPIAMTDPDWQMTEGKLKNNYKSATDHPANYLVIRDGDSLKLGSTTINFFVTPGHTLGVLSMAFPVKDGKNTYKAFMFGGVGLNFTGVKQTEMYLQSVDRISKMKGIQVNIANHPYMSKTFERNELTKNRKPGELNPFVDPEGFQEWLVELRVNAEKKLVEEKAKPN
ncbi:MAG: MBL fold metallo-hydrolase [Chitinophagaceae bacterium]